jgi:3-phenylpropionate/cinnamic acid dioxygenase small subunit
VATLEGADGGFMSDLQHRVEQFLYREACLMDENRYEDWLALFTENCRYWIPSNREGADPTREVSILYGDRAMLENHVRRLASGKAFAQSPPSRMRRIVSNVVANADDAGEIEAAANFIVVETRLHVQRLHAGRSLYRLVEYNGDLAIRYKQINLLGIDEPQENITFLL